MSENNGRLKIHTNARPAEEAISQEVMQTVCVREEPRPSEEKREPAGGQPHRERSTKSKRREREEQPLSRGEKLLRNTAAACALLLTVMALKNIDHPWSRQAAEGIKQAMTMRVDWDETLGKLSFVRAIVPDTALVFLDMGGGRDLIAPVNGEINHAFDTEQPWIEYRCAAGEAVCSAVSGMVTAAGRGAGNDWIVLVEREDGTETVYGYLAEVCVKAGDTVEEGQQLGNAADMPDARLYFEVRENGQSIDPTARLR